MSESARAQEGAVAAAGVVRVDWLLGERGPLIDAPGRVGLASCPGRLDCGGDVADDVAHLGRLGIRVVVSLVDDREMEHYGVVGLRPALRTAGITSLQFPIVDRMPPTDLVGTRRLCQDILGWLGEGAHVLIHCIGGWGRSGTIAAALLTHQDYDATTAINLVRAARSPRCVESRAQERFVSEYERHGSDCRRYYLLVERDEAAGLVGGSEARRLLPGERLPADRLLDAAALADAIRRRPTGSLRDLRILSGELERGATGAALPVDRLFAHDGERWVTLPLRDLSS